MGERDGFGLRCWPALPLEEPRKAQVVKFSILLPLTFTLNSQCSAFPRGEFPLQLPMGDGRCWLLTLDHPPAWSGHHAPPPGTLSLSLGRPGGAGGAWAGLALGGREQLQELEEARPRGPAQQLVPRGRGLRPSRRGMRLTAGQRSLHRPRLCEHTCC